MLKGDTLMSPTQKCNFHEDCVSHMIGSHYRIFLTAVLNDRKLHDTAVVNKQRCLNEGSYLPCTLMSEMA